jgi:hypothetical protein
MPTLAVTNERQPYGNDGENNKSSGYAYDGAFRQTLFVTASRGGDALIVARKGDVDRSRRENIPSGTNNFSDGWLLNTASFKNYEDLGGNASVSASFERVGPYLQFAR